MTYTVNELLKYRPYDDYELLDKVEKVVEEELKEYASISEVVEGLDEAKGQLDIVLTSLKDILVPGDTMEEKLQDIKDLIMVIEEGY